MRKKHFIEAICLLSAVTLLPACSKDDVEPDLTPPWQYSWWGYFDGTFDGTSPVDDLSVSFENESDHTRTTSSMQFMSQAVAGVDQDQICMKYVGIEYIEGATLADKSYIELSLSGVFPGTKCITMSKRGSVWEDNYRSTILLTRNYSGGSGPVYYVPSEHNPFRVDLLDVKWNTPHFATIEAKLDGVLYRQDAPQKDSIIIKAVFGAGDGLNSMD